jgi:hypothetical protein
MYSFEFAEMESRRETTVPRGWPCVSLGSVERQQGVEIPAAQAQDASAFHCGICLATAHTPIMLPCNHIFCDYCISEYSKRPVGSRLGANSFRRCPYCRGTYTISEMRMLTNFPLDKRRQFEGLQLPCPNQCGSTILGLHTRVHLRILCNRRLVACPSPYCDKRDIEAHLLPIHITECTNYAVGCPSCHLPVREIEFNSHNCFNLQAEVIHGLMDIIALDNGGPIPPQLNPAYPEGRANKLIPPFFTMMEILIGEAELAAAQFRALQAGSVADSSTSDYTNLNSFPITESQLEEELAEDIADEFNTPIFEYELGVEDADNINDIHIEVNLNPAQLSLEEIALRSAIVRQYLVRMRRQTLIEQVRFARVPRDFHDQPNFLFIVRTELTADIDPYGIEIDVNTGRNNASLHLSNTEVINRTGIVRDFISRAVQWHRDRERTNTPALQFNSLSVENVTISAEEPRPSSITRDSTPHQLTPRDDEVIAFRLCIVTSVLIGINLYIAFILLCRCYLKTAHRDLAAFADP